MYMQPFDVALLAALGISAVRGYQIGFTRQLFSTVGFATGGLLGSRIGPWISEHLSGSESLQPMVILLVVLALGAAGMLVGEMSANHLKRLGKSKNTHQFDAISGVVIAVGTFIFGIWIAGVLLALAPTSALQTAAANSQILHSIDQTMPSATQFLSGLNTLIGGSDTPEVFIGSEPSPDARQPLPSLSDLTAASLKARDTVVKIEGIGCGNIIDGSGFFISPTHVVTNAHVVAGIGSPKIIVGDRPVSSSLVWFDAAMDLAVLMVSSPHAQYLTLSEQTPSNHTPVLIIGYPRGGDRASQPGNVTDLVKALGKDIYGNRESIREVLAIQSSIVQGNSGGPVLNKEGDVIGVVFATSTTYNNIGYAVSSSSVHSSLLAATKLRKSLATPVCIAK